MRLTAIICNYNHAEYLPQALAAMAESRRPPDELIVVDDASTDGSRSIIEEFAARQAFVRVIWHEQNQGWHAGTAHALAIATGDWIYSGAADDYVLPEFFARGEEAAARWPQAGVVCGAIRRILPDGQLLRRQDLPEYRQPTFIPPERFARDPRLAWRSFSPSTIYRRAAIDFAGGFRRELSYWSDTFVIRVAGHRWGMAYFPDDCVCYREMSAGMSGAGSRDFERLSAIIRTAERLMRSADYAPLFPPETVRWWRRQAESEVRDAIRACCAAEMDVAFAPVIELLTNLPPGASSGARLRLWCCRKLLAAAYRVARRAVVATRTRALCREVLAGEA